MFCPKCGKSEKSAETYCRQCGTFLPDLSKPLKKRESPPEEHIKVNSVLNMMTIIVSFTLAILLYVFVALGWDTHILIFVTAGLLIAIGGWHIQTFIRTRKLRKQLKAIGLVSKKKERSAEPVEQTPKMLDAADFGDMVLPSVTDHTTKHLADPQKRSA